MYEVSCSTCPKDLTFEERLKRDCVQCKFSSILLANLYCPADVSNGSFYRRVASCNSMYELLKFALQTAGGLHKYESIRYAHDEAVLRVLRREFPFVTFIFRGREKADLMMILSDVLEMLYRKRLQINGAGVVEYGETLGVNYDSSYSGNLYGYYGGITAGKLSDIVENMAYAGIKMMWGVTDMSSDNAVEYCRDDDLYFGERPFHYRIVHIVNDAVIYVLFANEKHHPIKREVEVVDVVDDLIGHYSDLSLDSVTDNSIAVVAVDPVHIVDTWADEVERDYGGGIMVAKSVVELDSLQLKNVKEKPDGVPSMIVDSTLPQVYHSLHERDKTKSVYVGTACSHHLPIINVSPIQKAGLVKLIFVPDGFNNTPAIVRSSCDHLKYINKTTYMAEDNMIIANSIYYTDDVDMVVYAVTHSTTCVFKFVGTYHLKGEIDTKILEVRGYGNVVTFRTEIKRKAAIDNLITPLVTQLKYYIGADVVVMPKDTHVNVVTVSNNYCYRKLFSNWVNRDSDSPYFDSNVRDIYDRGGLFFDNHRRFDLSKVSDGYYHIDYGNMFDAQQVYKLLCYMVD